jgi:hypothetical protein
MLYLRAAAVRAEAAGGGPEDVGEALAAIMLAVGATEAFINQVTFLLADHTGTGRFPSDDVPAEILTDPLGYQRATELTLKWAQIGGAVLRKGWPNNPALWGDFTTLVAIRNELVHPKVDDFEQVNPPPTTLHPILRRLPARVALRKAGQAWPYRLLSPSAAQWASGVASDLIERFKVDFQARY